MAGRLTIIGGGVMGLMATASFGLTRSVRNDYRDPDYARLAFEARRLRREAFDGATLRARCTTSGGSRPPGSRRRSG